MTKKQRLNLLNKLEELDQIPAINSGGCAIAAYAIKKYLKTQDIKSNIIYLMDYEEEYIELSNGNAESCAHAIIQVGNNWYDSSGLLNKQDVIKEYAEVGYLKIPKKLAKKSIQRSQWNPSFDAYQYTPEIAQILNISLKELT